MLIQEASSMENFNFEDERRFSFDIAHHVTTGTPLISGRILSEITLRVACPVRRAVPICELDSEKARAEVLKVISRLESWRLLEPMRSLRSNRDP